MNRYGFRERAHCLLRSISEFNDIEENKISTKFPDLLLKSIVHLIVVVGVSYQPSTPRLE